VTIAALYELSKRGDVEKERVAAAIQELGFDPEKIDPARA
jgi:pyruvate dehydrogenase complex dehydrogenase (E1) component